MGKSILAVTFFVLAHLLPTPGTGIADEANPSEKSIVWQIGTPDNDTAEFAFAPKGHRQFREPGLYVIGASDPAKDWPYVHPGPSDGWAPGGPHTFVILFGLEASPIGPCRLVLDLVDTHSVRPPKLRVEINAHTWDHQTPVGAGDETVSGDPSKGREHVVNIDVPARALKAGNNTVAITSVSGSWVLWDAVRFEASEHVPLNDVTSAICSVQSKPALVRRGGQVVQPAVVRFLNLGSATEASLQVAGSALQPVSLKSGYHAVEMLLEPVASPTSVTIQLREGDRIVDERTFRQEPVRKWVIHLIHQTHLDIGYTHTQEDVLKRQVGFLYTALDLIKETEDYPEDARFRWHPEGMWAIDEFLRTATEEKRKEFLDAIRNGSIHLDGFYVHMMTGLGTEEELLQLMQPAKDFEREYGVPVTTAIGSDVPGYTWGLVSAMGQQGLKYLNTAPNNNHRLGFIYLLGNKPFYWVDPSGEHRVLCWMVPNSYIHFWGGRHRDVGASVLHFIDHYLVAKDYPYDIAQIRFSIGGDNGHPDPDLARQVKEWNEKYAYPKIILSTNTRLFSEFEERYGKDLPVLSGDLTPYWEDGAASTSAGLAINRRAKEKLDQAERLWTMLDPRAKFHDRFRQAWHNAIMYDEHTWGAHCSVSQPFSEFTISQEKFKQRFALTTCDIANEILKQAPSAIATPDSISIDLYNTASWDRAGVVMLPETLSSGGERLVDAAGNTVPTQRLKSGELAVLAPTIPALGGKRFTLQPAKAEAAGDIVIQGNVLENEKVKVAIDPTNGSIASIFSKTFGKELVDRKTGFGLNDYLYTLGRVTGEGCSRITTPATVTVEDAGPVVGTIKIECNAPGCNRLVRRVRIFCGLDRIDLVNDVDKLQELRPESVYFAFPFNVPGGQPRINVPFTVVRPEKDQLPGANRNYYCVQRWVDISNADYGVTWITRDAPMLKFHPFKIIGRGRGCLPAATMMYDKTPEGVPEFWDRSIDAGPFFYSWVMTNHWETNYKAFQEGPHRFTYTLLPHGKYDQAAAQRGAKSIAQPLLAVAVSPDQPILGPMLRVEGDGVLVTSLRPSRDFNALMVRLYAASGEPERCVLKWAEPKNVYRSDPQESRGSKIEGPVELPAYGVVTLRVEPQ